MNNFIKVFLISITASMISGCQTSSDIEAMKNKNKAIHTITNSINKNASLKPTLDQIPKSLLDNLKPSINKNEEPERYSINVNDSSLNTVINNIASITGENIILAEQIKNMKVTLYLKDITFRQLINTLQKLYKLHIEYKNNIYIVKPPTIITRYFVMDYINIKGIDDMEDINTYHEGLKTSGQLLETTSRTADNDNYFTNRKNENEINEESGIKKLTLDPEERLKKHNNFWSGLHITLLSIISDGKRQLVPGNSVNIDPFSGMITIQAYSHIMPKVEEYLNRLQKRVQRQVIIKAKIVEVDSSRGLDTGLDISDLFGASYNGTKGEFAFDYTKTGLSDFKSTLKLLSEFGKTTVLSNPVISTLNNQKAKIRVGEFEYFSTGESTNIIPGSGGNNIQTQDIELQPYFSGISLGVTPQISDTNNIIMKIMPSINYVTERDVTIKLPTTSGNTSSELIIPTAKTELREAETMVRVRDGEIIVIGGLTQNGARISRSGIPGIGYDATTEREERSWRKNILILLQPIVVSNGNWNEVLESFKKNLSDN